MTDAEPSFDAERLRRALQANQDHAYLDDTNHRYHCGGTCGDAIARVYVALSSEPSSTEPKERLVTEEDPVSRPDRCPFDGGTATIERTERGDGYANFPDDPDRWAYFVQCRTCAASGPWSKSNPAAAVRQWNARHV